MTVDKMLTLNHVLQLIIDNAKEVDAVLKFKMLTIVKEFEPYVANFEQVRNEKIKEYGTIGDDGEPTISFDDKNYEKFADEIKPLLEQEVDVKVDKLKSSDVFDKGVPANYLSAIYDLIEQ